MNAELLQSILTTILVITLFQLGMLYKLNSSVKELVAINKKLVNPPQAELDLRNGDVDAFIERCLKDISEQPRHAKPRWYLARAYYQKEMWTEAKQQFETLAKLEPSWKAKSIDPYVLAIDAQMKSDSPCSNS